MPLVQYGCYAGAGAKDELEIAIEEALRVGYRGVDTAECYDTEENVGRALHKIMQVNCQAPYMTNVNKAVVSLS